MFESGTLTQEPRCARYYKGGGGGSDLSDADRAKLSRTAKGGGNKGFIATALLGGQVDDGTSGYKPQKYEFGSTAAPTQSTMGAQDYGSPAQTTAVKRRQLSRGGKTLV